MTSPSTPQPAGPADAAAIAALHARCFEDGPWEEEGLGRMLSAPTTLCLALRRPSGVAGFVLCRVVADECEVLSCAVAPAARGHGLARRLLAAAFEEAGRRGARQVFLEVDEVNGPARALYAALGMRPVGRRRAYYPHRGRVATDAVVMARDL